MEGKKIKLILEGMVRGWTLCLLRAVPWMGSACWTGTWEESPIAGEVWKAHLVFSMPRCVRCMTSSFLIKVSLASQKKIHSSWKSFEQSIPGLSSYYSGACSCLPHSLSSHSRRLPPYHAPRSGYWVPGSGRRIFAWETRKTYPVASLHVTAGAGSTCP